MAFDSDSDSDPEPELAAQTDGGFGTAQDGPQCPFWTDVDP